VQTDATPAARLVRVAAAAGRLRAELAFDDGARLQADAGADRAPLALDGFAAEAETGALWCDAAGRAAALVGAGRPGCAHGELSDAGAGWQTVPWPAMQELNAGGEADTSAQNPEAR
jgi:hypothetical protein